MKKTLLFLILCGSLFAGDELNLLDNLIHVTNENLHIQKELRKQAEEYLALQAAYLKKDQDRELLLKVAKKADKVLEKIKENHLEQAFETKFLSELSLFAKFAHKGGIPRS